MEGEEIMEKVSELGFWQRMAAEQGLIILFFSSAGCHSCRIWRGLLREYEMTREDLRVWEVDAGIDMGLTREFDVYHLPALFLFKNGRYLRPLQVEARPQALHRLVESVKDLPGEEQP